MFGANPRKSAETIELINKAFTARARGREGYTIVYGYSAVPGLSRKQTNYVLGFSVRERELVVLAISPSGESMGDAYFFKAGKGVQCRKNLDGSIHISAPELPKDLDILVPPSSPDTNEGLSLRAVNQYEAAANFMSFVKSI